MQIPGTLLKAIEQYLAGTATPEQQQLVYDWYHSFDDGQVELPLSIIEMRTRVGKRIWSRLEETIQENEQPAVPDFERSRRYWRQIAVAAVLLLVAGLFLLREFSGKKEAVPVAVTPVTHDVQPGGPKAVLILADGTKIVLDSAANGTLSQQGKTRIIKTENGQVLYDAGAVAKLAQEEILYNTMTTPRGGLYKLTLSDGTEVWLNASSRIRYPAIFRGDTRTVEISGEVFFKVAKNKDMPFRVIIGNEKKNVIEVTGTQFNVNAYDDEAAMKTTLLEGSVNVQLSIDPAKGREQSSMLKPGQQAVITHDSRFSVHDDIDVDEATAWINGLFQFKDTDIQSLMRQLARWYDIEVVYQGTVSPLLITGKAPRNISLASMLKILELSDVKYSIDGKILTVL